MKSRPETNDSIVLKTASKESLIKFGPFEEADFDPHKTAIVADSFTVRYMPNTARAKQLILVPRGEAAKSLKVLEQVYAGLLAMAADRSWSLMAVGGGSICDLAGLAAATWMRGINCLLLPTTLLSMLDASIGGKTAVDYQAYKNLIGVFSQPAMVCIDISSLKSLDKQSMAGGMAEAVKHAVLGGEAMLDSIENAIAANGSVKTEKLEDIVKESILFKKTVVEADEREKGFRSILNLGHSFGHAIEAASGLPHGYAVSAGLGLAFDLAVKRGASLAASSKVKRLLKKIGLPTSLEEARLEAIALSGAFDFGDRLRTNISDPDSFVKAVEGSLANDKKRCGYSINFVLPMDIGQVKTELLSIDYLIAFLTAKGKEHLHDA
ncbi:3-dehydroquinate synthase [Spirochaetota bacterium]